MSSLVIPFGVLMVVGMSFLIDRSSMTKSAKALTRIGVLVALSGCLSICFALPARHEGIHPLGSRDVWFR
jgi:hypothetical protein